VWLLVGNFLELEVYQENLFFCAGVRLDVWRLPEALVENERVLGSHLHCLIANVLMGNNDTESILVLK
jgi:hypothetical protein